jgi:hypothetical protein
LAQASAGDSILLGLSSQLCRDSRILSHHWDIVTRKSQPNLDLGSLKNNYTKNKHTGPGKHLYTVVDELPVTYQYLTDLFT